MVSDGRRAYSRAHRTLRGHLVTAGSAIVLTMFVTTSVVMAGDGSVTAGERHALTVAGPAPPEYGTIDSPLTAELLHDAAAEAKVAWQAAQPDADFSAVTLTVDDLPGDLLGRRKAT